MPPERAKRDKPREFRIAAGGIAAIAAAAAGEDGKPKLATFQGNAYTGGPMKPQGWWTPIVVDFAGVVVPSQHRPALRQHDHEQIVGHTSEVVVTAEGDDQGIHIAGVFSGEKQHTDKVTVPAGNGFQWQLSIGADPVRTEWLEAGETTTVNGREITGPCTISRETLLGEISFVPLGADGDTSAVVSASKGSRRMNAKAMLKLAGSKFSDDEVDAMTDDEAKAALKECMADDDDTPPPKAKAKGADEDDDDDETDTDLDADDDDEDEKPKAKAKASKKTMTAKARRQQRLEASRKSEAAEFHRVDGIKAKVREYGVEHVVVDGKTVPLIAHAIEAGWSVMKTEHAALKASRPAAGVGNGPHVYTTHQPEISDAVLEAAVFQAAGHEFKLFDDEFYDGKNTERGALPGRYKRMMQGELKARYPDKVMQAAHTAFKGRLGLQQLLTRIAAMNGYRGSEVIRDSDDLGRVASACMKPIQADGASTASIANVLSNVQNKFLGQGYLFCERAWAEICYIRSVKDFKETKNINLFGDFEYKDVGTSGELKNATLQDQAFSNQAKTSGRIITITRQHIINDDMGALTTVPMLLGRGAGLKLNRAFWTLWLSMGNDEGGSTAFWAAVHTIANQQAASNLITGGSSALSSESLQTAKQTFDKQVDPMGNPLGIEARILLYSTENDQNAWELMNSSAIVAGGASSKNRQPAENRWKGKYKPVMSRYISNSNYTGNSSTAWWLLADPAECPVVEVVFLNGQEMPTVQVAGPDFQFNVLGISTRAFLDSGVQKQNFRGGVRSDGA